MCQKNQKVIEKDIKLRRMKKLILLPKKDTITICLPENWVGKPLECILRHPEEKSAYPEDLEIVSEVRE